MLSFLIYEYLFWLKSGGGGGGGVGGSAVPHRDVNERCDTREPVMSVIRKIRHLVPGWSGVCNLRVPRKHSAPYNKWRIIREAERVCEQ